MRNMQRAAKLASSWQGRKQAGGTSTRKICVSVDKNHCASWSPSTKCRVACSLKTKTRIRESGKRGLKQRTSHGSPIFPSLSLLSLLENQKGNQKWTSLPADHLRSSKSVVQSLITASLLTCSGAKASSLLSLLPDSSSSGSRYVLLPVWSS